MKFYDELYSSELKHFKIPAGVWIPVYLQDPGESDPPIKIVLELLEVKTLIIDHILWAYPGDFIRKYIEPYGETTSFIVFVDDRDYFFSYISSSGQYFFENLEVSLTVIDRELFINYFQSELELDLAIVDFSKLGFSEVHLKLRKKNGRQTIY